MLIILILVYREPDRNGSIHALVTFSYSRQLVGQETVCVKSFTALLKRANFISLSERARVGLRA